MNNCRTQRSAAAMIYVLGAAALISATTACSGSGPDVVVDAAPDSSADGAAGTTTPETAAASTPTPSSTAATTSTSTSTSTSSTSSPSTTTSSTTSSTTTTVPEPAPDLIAAAPAIPGYSYGEFAVTRSAFSAGTAVAVEVSGLAGSATLSIHRPAAPLTTDDQRQVIRRVELEYGRTASSWVGWRRLDDHPVLAFENASGLSLLWFHAGLMFRLSGGDDTFNDYVIGLAASQHPEFGPPPETMTLMEGAVPERFLEVPGYSYVAPGPGMQLNALDNHANDALHFAMRVVAGPGVTVTVADQFNVSVVGSEVVFLEASSVSMLTWFNRNLSSQPDGPLPQLGDGVRLERVAGVPVVMADTYWEWLDGPVYMTAWLSDAEAFAGMRPFLEALIMAQAEAPLSLTGYWLE